MPTLVWNEDRLFNVGGEGHLFEGQVVMDVLMPGPNQVKPLTLRYLQAHPHAKLYFEGSGGPRDMEGKLHISPADYSLPDGLKGLSENTAIDVASKTSVADVLTGWLANETRAKVRAAIQGSLDQLDPSKPDVRPPLRQMPQKVDAATEKNLGHFGSKNKGGGGEG